MVREGERRKHLCPGTGKTKTGRLWTYVRDDRPASDQAAPAVWYAYSADRGGQHPEQHLKTFQGALQADAYAGFNQLYRMGGFRKWHAGHMVVASSMIWNKPMVLPWPGKLWNGSQLYMPSRMRFVDGHRRNENKFGKPELAPCSRPCMTGSKSR